MGLKKLVNIGRVGLAAGAIYAGALGCDFKEKPKASSQITLPDMKLPDKLTQQTPDFYKNPTKEFEVYKQTYVDCSRDKIIDSEDVEVLESILSKTLEEIKGKVIDETGELKENLPQDAEMREYMSFVRDMGEKDLRELRAHLNCKKKWLETKAVKGKFWNYGTGAIFYANYYDNGNVGDNGIWLDSKTGAWGLPKLFKDKKFYEHISSGSIVQGDYNYPEVPELWEEFPAKTKFNYWLGMLLGLAIPFFAGLSAVARRIERKHYGGWYRKEDAEAASFFGHFAPGVAGFFLFDSIHPWVYPARLGFNIVYETGQWILGGKDKDQSGITPSSEIDTLPKSEEAVKKAPKKFVNPFEIDLGDGNG